MSKVKNENYIVIQGFMVNELKLKGNELLVYSIIYGFSQDEDQMFNGSLQYLADWTNSTKQGVLKNLKSLIEKGYIEKKENVINGVKFCEYSATKFNRVLNKVEQGVKQSLIGGSKQSLIGGVKQSLHNNISLDNINNNNIKDNINNNIPFDEIIDFLNQSAGTNFRSSAKKTRDLIKTRFNEGYTLEDFKIVITNKCYDWLSNNEMQKYLRPETLFGTKFEGYLGQKKKELTTKDLEKFIDINSFNEEIVSNGNVLPNLF